MPNWVGSGVVGTDTQVVMYDGVVGDPGVTPAAPGNALFTFEVLEVTPPSAEAKVIDMTHMESEDFKEAMPGKIIEWTECELNIAYRPADIHTGQLPLDTDVRYITIQFPAESEYYEPLGGAETKWTFPGWISAFEPTAPLEDRMTATIRIQCAGTITGFTMYE